MLPDRTPELRPYLSDRLSVAIEAARNAGELLLTSPNLRDATQNGLEFKAVVDQLADETIVQTLKDHFPDDAVLTEERGFPKEVTKRLWVVDPLDGTTNFLNGNQMYTTLVAYIENGVPLISVSYLPASDKMVYAVTGHGVYVNGRKLQAQEPHSLQRAIIVLDQGYDPKGIDKIVRAYRQLRPHVGNIGMFNGNGYTLTLMALDQIAGFVHFSSKIWEVAGLHIAQEAGATITDLTGKPIRYDFQNPSAFQFVASHGIPHGDLLALVNSS